MPNLNKTCIQKLNLVSVDEWSVVFLVVLYNFRCFTVYFALLLLDYEF